MIYTYFVSFAYKKRRTFGWSDAVVKVREPISIEAIQEIRDGICASGGYRAVAIINFILLGTEEDHGTAQI